MRIWVGRGSSAPKLAKMFLKVGMTKTIRKMVTSAQMERTMAGYIMADLTFAFRASELSI